MIDLEVRDLTLPPDDPEYVSWIVLSGAEWDKVKQYIEQVKEQNE